MAHHSLVPVRSCSDHTYTLLNRSHIFSLNSPNSATQDHSFTLDYSVFSCPKQLAPTSSLEINPDSSDGLKPGPSHVDGSSTVEARRFECVQEIMVTTLGTGSAAPSKYRNVSSTLLHLPQREGVAFDYILLDAGEGTLGQLKRKFGDGWKEMLRNLKLVFISHLHADHHCGLGSLLAERIAVDGCGPLAIVCQYGVYLHLVEKSVIEPLGLSRSQVKWFNAEVLLKSCEKRLEAMETIKTFLSSQFNVETIAVKHWGRCFGVCLEDKVDGWKIVFSGDTRPCEALIRIGQDADLLIHEASLGPEETELAEIKGHSTIDQAIQVALKMNAKNCVLNHFSGRYPKIPPSIITETDHNMNIVISFDFMSSKIGELGELQKLLPIIEQVVEGHEKEVLDDSQAEPSPVQSTPGKKTGHKRDHTNKKKNRGGFSPGNATIVENQIISEAPQILDDEIEEML